MLCALFCIRTGLNGHSREGGLHYLLFFFGCNHLGFPLIPLSPRDGHQRVHVVRRDRVGIVIGANVDSLGFNNIPRLSGRLPTHQTA